MEKRAKKHYSVVRKNQADTKALLRAAVCGYLFYLAWKLAESGGSTPSFPPFAAWTLGGLLALAAAAFGWFTWREYKKALAAAELTPEEEKALRQERGE